MEPISAVISLASSVLDKIFPNAADKAKLDEAKLALLQMQSQNELKTLELQIAPALAEAKSEDKWTARARPTFMYVMYIMLLFSLPMGVCSAINPEIATRVGLGMKEWLAAIPTPLYELFGICFFGYAVGRSAEKIWGIKK